MDSLQNKKLAMGYMAFMARIFNTHCYLWVQTDSGMIQKNLIRVQPLL
jgi:hypothetical protein